MINASVTDVSLESKITVSLSETSTKAHLLSTLLCYVMLLCVIYCTWQLHTGCALEQVFDKCS